MANNEQGNITPNTQIVFTLKGFVGTIVAILGLFVGFHKLVIVPTLENHSKEIKALEEKNDAKIETITNKLIEISNGVGAINGNIEGINNRLQDMNTGRSSNQSGSFD